jgi:NAD(P)-dependent dehydrogenase (short-subunit alcohol dehydrogenase family)
LLEKITVHKGLEIFSLKGKTALITGATGYLGSAMAFILAEAGAKVLVNSRSKIRSNRLVDKLKAEGLLAECAIFDITSDIEIQQYAETISGQPLHILINNAYAGGAGNIELTDPDSYACSYDITVLSAHKLLKTYLSNLRLAVKETGGASVINLASMYALVSPDQRIYKSASSINPPFYGAAKAALLHWSRYAACEFGHEGIRINALSPGPFPSEKVKQNDPEFIQQLCNKVPMRRVGISSEIKGPILFLSSDAASYINGSNIVVDGGWTCW